MRLYKTIQASSDMAISAPTDSTAAPSHSDKLTTHAQQQHNNGDVDMTTNIDTQNVSSIHHAQADGSSDTDTNKAVARVETICQSINLLPVRFHVTASNYYELSLEERAKLLDAQSIHQLCKCLLMKNTKWRAHPELSPRENPQFIIVMIQFTARLHNDKLGKAVYTHLSKSSKLIRKHKDFNWRLASSDENDTLTGYSHNAVCPIGLADSSLPIVMSDRIAALPQNECWLGAGHQQAKMCVDVKRFIECMNVVVADISYDDQVQKVEQN